MLGSIACSIVGGRDRPRRKKGGMFPKPFPPL
jgi:hypothetical protein